MIGAGIFAARRQLRPPLIVRSVVNGRRYLTALVLALIATIPFGLLALGIARPPPTIVVVAVLLFGYSICAAANTFLGYPRLFLSGNVLTIWSNPFWPGRTDLSPYGPAYAVHRRTRAGLGTALAFRTAADEAAHRAAEKFPFGPEFEEAAKTIAIDIFVGRETEKAEALEAEINVHRGLA